MDLLNEAWRYLHDTKAMKWKHHEIRRINRDHFGNIRRSLAQARPFSVDNRALKMAYELSLEEPRKVAKRLMLARLPFPKTWLEIDFREKVKLGVAAGHNTPIDDTTPVRIGWLLEEAPGDPHIWRTTAFNLDAGRVDEEPVGMGMVSYMVDTLNRAPPSAVGPVYALSPEFLDDVIQFDVADRARGIDDTRAAHSFRHMGWGYSGPVESGNSLDQRMRQIAVAKELDNSINIGMTPITRALMEFYGAQKIKEMVVENAVESRGDVRLIVSLLSLINEVPIILEKSRPSGKVRMGGQLKPYLQTSKVTINLPTKRYKTVLRGILKNAAISAKARHEVRGHFRTIVHKHTHTRKVEKPDGSIVREVILKGHKERVWVNAHERGDARLGYVKHTYDVTKRAGS